MFIATARSVTASAALLECIVNIEDLQTLRKKLYSVVNLTKRTNWKRSCNPAGRGELENFIEGDYFLAASEECHNSGQLSLQWIVPRYILKSIND